MKWYRKNKPKPQIGDRRIKRRFQWYPLCLNGVCRWLEMVEVEQEYVESYTVLDAETGIVPDYYWSDVEWLDV